MTHRFVKVLICCLAFGLAGCNLPSLPVSLTAATPNLTQVNATIDTGFTQTNAAGAVTSTPQPPNSTSHPTTTLIPTDSQAQSIHTGTPIMDTTTQSRPCNRVVPDNPVDITIPDNTQIQPGESFTKTWRLINAGSCPWTNQYSVVWFSGESLSAPRVVYLNRNVNPGESADITIDMVAPDQSGYYQGNWKLSSPDGQLFGIGPTGNSPFWVRILVEKIATATPSPTPTSTATPVVGMTGLASLMPGDAVDLETALLNQNGADDLSYTIEANNVAQLNPLHGARLVVFGGKPPTLQDCMNTAVSSEPVVINGVSMGVYFCYRTNEGMPGWLRLVFRNTTDLNLTMDILTWEIP